MKFILKAYDRSKLTKKVIFDRHGRKTTRWVKLGRKRRSKIVSRKLPSVKNADKYETLFDIDSEKEHERLHDFLLDRLYGYKAAFFVDDNHIDSEIDKIDSKMKHLKYKYDDIRVLSFSNHIRGDGRAGVIVGKESEKNIIKNNEILEPPKFTTSSGLSFLGDYVNNSDLYNTFIRLDDLYNMDKSLAQKIGWSKEKLKAGISSLKGLVNRTKDNVTLYRYISSGHDTGSEYSKKKGSFFDQARSHKIGDSFEDDSFVSTTNLSPKDIYTTFFYGEFGTKHDNDDDVIFMELEVEPGVGYIDANQALNSSNFTYECEVLLGDGLKFELTKIRKERIFETDYQVNVYKVTRNK